MSMVTKLNDSLKKEQKEIRDKIFNSIIKDFDNGEFEYEQTYYDKRIIFPSLKIYITELSKGRDKTILSIMFRLKKYSKFISYERITSSNGRVELPIFLSFVQRFKLARRILTYFNDLGNENDVHKNKTRLETLKNFLKSNKKINRDNNLNEILGDK